MRREAKRARFDANGGREGLAKRVLEIATEIVRSGSYKRAIAGAGQMRALAEICEADTYWDEKCSFGYRTEHDIQNGHRKINISDDANSYKELES